MYYKSVLCGFVLYDTPHILRGALKANIVQICPPDITFGDYCQIADASKVHTGMQIQFNRKVAHPMQ